MRPAHDDVSHWLGAYLHWSQLAVSTPQCYFLQCNEINMTMPWVGVVLLFYTSIIGQCTEHIASHYIVPRHIESTILRLSNSWYPTTSTTHNTYIDYWSQTDAVQSLNVVPSICHRYCVTLVCLVIPPATKLRGGILDSPCSSVRLSVCLSVRPSVRGLVSGW